VKAVRELLSVFSAELFLPHLHSTNKDDVLVEMVDAAVAAKRVRNRDLLLHALEQRESLGPTAIGKGVALPHCRSLAVRDLIVVVGRSLEGINFGAQDGKPVQILFLIAAPPQDKENRYLTVLGRLVDLVKDAPSRKRILQAGTIEDFMGVVEAHEFDV
jgi:mannitol/fructose-specific phosphotransferase system IIA component (Ntr-type)